MSDLWDICIVHVCGQSSKVLLYVREKESRYAAGWRVDEFIKSKYPCTVPPQDDKDFSYLQLIKQLLKDGWEPFSVTGAEEISGIFAISFRKRVE